MFSLAISSVGCHTCCLLGYSRISVVSLTLNIIDRIGYLHVTPDWYSWYVLRSIHLMFCGEGFGTIHPWVHFLLTWRSWIFWIRNIRKTNSWWYWQIFICTLDIADDVADLVWIPYGPESNWSTGVSLPTSVRPKVTTRRLLLWCGALSGSIQAFSFSCALKSQVTGCVKSNHLFQVHFA